MKEKNDSRKIIMQRSLVLAVFIPVSPDFSPNLYIHIKLTYRASPSVSVSSNTRSLPITIAFMKTGLSWFSMKTQ